MTETFTLLVADNDDELRDGLVGQLLADGFQANPARTAAQARCRAGHGRTRSRPRARTRARYQGDASNDEERSLDDGPNHAGRRGARHELRDNLVGPGIRRAPGGLRPTCSAVAGR